MKFFLLNMKVSSCNLNVSYSVTPPEWKKNEKEKFKLGLDVNLY